MVQVGISVADQDHWALNQAEQHFERTVGFDTHEWVHAIANGEYRWPGDHQIPLALVTSFQQGTHRTHIGVAWDVLHCPSLLLELIQLRDECVGQEAGYAPRLKWDQHPRLTLRPRLRPSCQHPSERAEVTKGLAFVDHVIFMKFELLNINNNQIFNLCKALMTVLKQQANPAVIDMASNPRRVAAL